MIIILLFLDTCAQLSSAKCVPCNCDTQGSRSSSCDSKGKCTCKDTFKGTKCGDRDCEMTNWSAWTTCPCGTNDPKTRNRSVKIQPSGEGEKCKQTEETATCTMTPCDCSSKPGYYGDKCDKRDCVLTKWSSWSSCQSCPARCADPSCPQTISPQKTRTRSVKTAKDGNGRDCSGSKSETNSCGYRCYRRCVGRPGGAICGYRRYWVYSMTCV